MQVRGLLQAAASLHQAGRLADAALGYRRALAAAPESADGWNLLGTALLQGAQPLAAGRLLERALITAPGRHLFRLNLGYALIDNGEVEKARDVLEAGCRVLPAHDGMWSALGAARKRLADEEGAARALKAALILTPGTTGPLYNLALLRQEHGAPEAALRLYDRVLMQHPATLAALTNRARALRDLGRAGEAVQAFRRVAIATPGDGIQLNDLGVLHWAENESAAAIALYRRARAAAPGEVEIARNLAAALGSSAHYEAAMDSYDAAIETHPEAPGLRVKRALTLPVIPRDIAQIDAARAKIGDFLASEESRKISITDPLHEIGAANFYLVYHGRNDKELATGISAFYRRACPALSYVAPHCRTPARPGARIRLGICSKHLAGHTIGAVFGDLVTGLDRARFELVLLRPPGLRDQAAAEIAAGFDHVVELPDNIPAAAERVASCALDALLYTDIGMEPFTYFLAHARLAPVQWVTWGHPVTTGIETIDAYLSPDCFEPEGAEAHYSEHLIRSPSIPMVYRDEPVPAAGSKADFGLPEERPLYLCPQNLFKLHPEFDHWLAALLAADPCGIIGLIEGANGEWTARVKARLGAVLGPAMDRVRFLPFMPKDRYMRLLGAADIMLDPIHFGGSNTTLGGFAAGTPVLTWPSQFMRGRMTMGLYRTMGVEDCIASGRTDYVEKAVRIANDPALRREIVEKIRAARPAVVGTEGASRDLGDLLADAVSRSNGSP